MYYPWDLTAHYSNTSSEGSETQVPISRNSALLYLETTTLAVTQPGARPLDDISLSEGLTVAQFLLTQTTFSKTSGVLCPREGFQLKCETINQQKTHAVALFLLPQIPDQG